MERIWYDKTRYDRAEKLYHEGLCNVSLFRLIISTELYKV